MLWVTSRSNKVEVLEPLYYFIRISVRKIRRKKRLRVGQNSRLVIRVADVRHVRLWTTRAVLNPACPQ
jgi:hypothetical protein